MNFDSYLVSRRRNDNKALSISETLEQHSFGLIGEYGEIVDTFKKIKYHKHPLEKESTELLLEFGDFCFYLFGIADILGVEESDFLNFIQTVNSNIKGNELANLRYLDYKLNVDSKLVSTTLINTNTMVSMLTSLLNKEDINSSRIKNLAIGLIRDIVYSLMILLNLLRTDLGEVFDLNIKKIQDRYPNGFNPQESICR